MEEEQVLQTMLEAQLPAALPVGDSVEDQERELPVDNSVDDQKSDCTFDLTPHGVMSSQVQDVAISRDHYQKALLDAAMINAPKAELKLPWEQGVLGIICGKHDAFPFTDPLGKPIIPAESSAISLPHAAPEIASASKKRSLDLPLYATAVKALRDEDAYEELDRLWSVAVGKWMANFEIMGFPGTIGNALLSSFQDADERFIILRDTLGIRSPRTAVKRAQTLQKFLQWLGALNINFFDIDRSHVLQYLSSSSERVVAATAGTSLMECFRFTKHVMGVPLPL